MTEQEIAKLGIEDLIVRDLKPDSKYSMVQGRLLHQDKNYLIPLDEPTYVTIGCDPTALQLAVHYNARLHNEIQSNIVVDHIKSSSDRVTAFSEFQAENPNDLGEIDTWTEYPTTKNEAFREDCANYAVDTMLDGKQSESFMFWDFKLFDRHAKRFLSPDMPIMIYRGKDALLVQIIKEHIELIEAQKEFYSEDTYLLLIKNAKESIKTIHKFHSENPERVGVTCSLFSSQEAKGDDYKEAMADNAKYLKLQEQQDGVKSV